jgi:hypothetical protein
MRDAYRRSALADMAREDGQARGPNGFAHEYADTRTWPEPDLGLFGDAMPSAPKLPLQCFGASGNYIQRASAGANAPADYVAATLLGAVSGLIGKSVEVRINKSWYEPLILWLAIIGPPSSGKTPAAKPIRKRLFAIQKQMIADHETKVDGMIAALKASATPGADKRATADLKQELERLEALRERPPRCIVGDSTVEALAEVEQRARLGLLVERDELVGLIAALERYNSGSDRPFYLEAWNNGPFTLDRVKYGNKFIPKHGFSIVGGIQPERLRSLLTHNGDDDGFMARLLPFWPDTVKPTSIPEGTFQDDMDTALERVAGLPIPEEGLVLGLSTEAFEMFNDWYGNDNASRHGTPGKIGSAFGKLPGYVARTAGVLHVLDWAYAASVDNLSNEVGAEHLGAALILMEDYIEPQIWRVYYGANKSDEESVAAAILQHCHQIGIRQFNLRDARREWGILGARSKDATKLFDAAIDLLEKSGWVRNMKGKTRAKQFEVNPALHRENMT